MSIISSMSSQFFKFRVIGESTWTIPAPVMENSDSISITSSWSTTNVQGSTEAMSAFNFVNNPTIPINIKFHEDLWRDYNPGHTYEETIAKLASLQYPGGTSTIEPPYVIISWSEYTFRGYFTNIRITQSGPFRNGHRVCCEVSMQFTAVKSASPTRSDVASSFRTTFQ